MFKKKLPGGKCVATSDASLGQAWLHEAFEQNRCCQSSELGINGDKKPINSKSNHLAMAMKGIEKFNQDSE